MFRYFLPTAIFALVCAAPIQDGVISTEYEPGMDARHHSSWNVATGGYHEAFTTTTSSTNAPFVDITDAGRHQSQDGSYAFHFRGEDGSSRQESAVVINPGTKDQFLRVSGSYSYFDADGKEVLVHYNADDRGFVPEGNNIMQSISQAAKLNSQQPRMLAEEEQEQRTELPLQHSDDEDLSDLTHVL